MQKVIEPVDTQIEFSRCFPTLVLASSSPNRRSLIEKGGTSVTVFIPEIEEEIRKEDKYEALMDIAERKLSSYIDSPSFNPDLPALSADTMVLIDGKLLGKPRDEENAREMLRKQSGKM